MPKSALTHSFSSIYLSNLLGSKVYLPSSQRIAVLQDLILLNEEPSKVVSCQLRIKRGDNLILDFSGFTISLEDHEYQIVCIEERDGAFPADAISLKKHILDQQIVDINDKKVVRVNDVRLAFVSAGAFPIAVDVGLSGLFRRLGVIETAQFAFRAFNLSVPSKLIRWRDIGLLGLDSGKIRLSVTQQKLHTLHPSDLSDIIEELDIKTGRAIFEALDHEKAADVLEELEDEAKLNIVEELPVEKATEVLSKMPADEVADILEDLDEDKAEELLSELDIESSNEIRELMDYPENSAGSFMNTEFLSFSAIDTVGFVMAELQRLKPEADVLYSLYVVDSEMKLLGVVSMREVLISESDAVLESLMDSKPLFVNDSDQIDDLAELICKYNLLVIPVLDEDDALVGTISITDILHDLLREGR